MSLDTILYPLALIKFWSNTISKDIEKLNNVEDIQELGSSSFSQFIDKDNSIKLTKSKEQDKNTKNIKL